MTTTTPINKEGRPGGGTRNGQGEEIRKQSQVTIGGDQAQGRLTPRQQRAVDALTEKTEGILSYELGRITGAMNIADLIMILRRMGFNIDCQMEPFTTQDGDKSRVGRYLLRAESRGRKYE